ncbi:MAG: chloride channel protein [Alphaproteobacteria bacterium]
MARPATQTDRPIRRDAVDRMLRLLGRAVRRHRIVLFCLAVIIGLLAGVASIGFREGIRMTQATAFGFVGQPSGADWPSLAWWQVLTITTLGGLIVGLFVRYVMPSRRPLGVADVIEASALKDGRMRFRAGLAAAAASAVSLGIGGSVGREGPVVHLGATLGAVIGRHLRLGPGLSRTLLGCGVASAVAASFNAPIAGVFFALEVVVGHYGLSAFAPVVIASVAGTAVSRVYFGDFPAFIIAEYGLASFYEFPAFGLLGIASAAAAIVFIRSVAVVERVSRSLPGPVWLRPMAGGLGIGLIGLAFPEVLGVGYEATDQALQQHFGFWLLVALVVAKTAATAVSLGSGLSGGVFSPALFIGAMLGGAFGTLATWAVPELSSGHGAYAIVGMGAVAGAVLGAPISTILIVFEMTGDYTLTLGVMIATTIASMLTQSLFGHSFFTWQLAQRGLSPDTARDMRALRTVGVRRLAQPDDATLPPDASLPAVRAMLRQASHREIFLVDGNGILCGVIAIADLGEAAFDASKDSECLAIDVARRDPPVLSLAEDLVDAMEVLDSATDERVAVVEDRRTMRMMGVVKHRDVLSAYRDAIAALRREERGEQ